MVQVATKKSIKSCPFRYDSAVEYSQIQESRDKFLTSFNSIHHCDANGVRCCKKAKSITTLKDVHCIKNQMQVSQREVLTYFNLIQHFK